MGDAAVERLTHLIADTPRRNDSPDNNNGSRPRRTPFELHIGISEGWFSLILLAIVVYSTIWCIQAAGWVDQLNILTLTTLLGMVLGKSIGPAGVIGGQARPLQVIAVALRW